MAIAFLAIAGLIYLRSRQRRNHRRLLRQRKPTKAEKRAGRRLRRAERLPPPIQWT
ncbi:hypothetical protein HYW30_01775 [Candidatus Azambacteria bacterium]|nr:hypothetical protein [Candidatus Azambacteria bacterium]